MKKCQKCKSDAADNYLICPKCGGRDFSVIKAVTSKQPAIPAGPPVSTHVAREPRKQLRPFMQVSLMPRWLVITAITIVLVFIGVLFVGNNQIADAIARKTSPQAEKELLAEFLATYKGKLILEAALSDDYYQSNLVNRIGLDLLEELSEPVGFDYRFLVIPDNSINAFALPGGMIVVFSGLIDSVETPERIAAVLAHEISHVEQRHLLRQSHRSVGTLGLTAMIFGAAQDLGTIATAELTLLKYSRDMEREADAEGARLLAKAGVSPKVMIEMLDILGQEEGGWSVTIMQTHPSPKSRSRLVEKMLETQRDLPKVKEAWH